MVEYHLFLPKTCRDCISSARKKVLTGIFLGYVLCAGGIWKGAILVADIEELELMDASEIHANRLNAKEVLTPKNCETCFFPFADGTVKLSGGDQVLRTSTLIRDSPDRGEEQGNLPGEADLSSSTPFRDSSPDDGETRNDFWSISGNYIYRHHVEPSVSLCVPREASFPNPLKFIDVTRATSTSLDVMLEKSIDDFWNVDGARDLPDTRTVFTWFTILDEKPPDGFSWSGDSKARLIVARDMERHVSSVETKREAKVGYRKTEA